MEESFDIENELFLSQLKKPYDKYYSMVTSVILGDYESSGIDEEEALFEVTFLILLLHQVYADYGLDTSYHCISLESFWFRSSLVHHILFRLPLRMDSDYLSDES